MTDRELLELAAKAYGPGVAWGVFGFGEHWLQPDDVLGGLKPWGPLTDDGDALRLAVKLKMCVTSFSDAHMAGFVISGKGYNMTEASGADPYAATRRAIVRAAAEIGRSME